MIDCVLRNHCGLQINRKIESHQFKQQEKSMKYEEESVYEPEEAHQGICFENIGGLLFLNSRKETPCPINKK